MVEFKRSKAKGLGRLEEKEMLLSVAQKGPSFGMYPSVSGVCCGQDVACQCWLAVMVYLYRVWQKAPDIHDSH